ncbi:helix-turn-helix transcriptional regulator [Leifsonia shinshuensis]|uniref:helix-turn-helix transcriptional regulator n=1 Tax=Leifsonia shinshuensis TaxID=150026 RepID=UPI002859F161|nr:helix-turn-helix transcriptional regulator [Leifsonia shinshuensis]MDR6973075.1 AraC-like DNA-binding protein [Leifsonia shinshuensis]
MPGTFFTRDEAADPESAEELLRRSYGDVSFGSDVRTSGLTYLEELRGDERMLLGRHRFGGDLSLSFDLPFIAVGLARGRYRWRSGGDEGDLAAAPALFQPEAGAHGVMDHAGVTVVAFDVRALARTARAQFGDEVGALEFVSASSVSAHAARHWRAVHDHAWRQVAAGAFDHPLQRASLFRQLAVATLETFPLAGDHEARRTTVAARAAAFKRAVAYIDEHASLPITADDIALAAGTSVPELTRAFDMHLPFAPLDYLRSVRLNAAHRDLIDPQGDDDAPLTVADVAARWGFPDEATFGRLYRERFGVAPEVQLRRSVG